MKIDVKKTPRIVVDRTATIDGIEFDLDALGDLLEALDSERIQVVGAMAAKLKELGAIKFEGRRGIPATLGHRFQEALDAVRLAIDKADEE